MKYATSLILFVLCGCASHYTSLDQVRGSVAQKVISSPLSLEQSYENVLTQASECFLIDVYRVVSIKKEKSAEISVLAMGVSSSNVWLSINLEEISKSETKASLYWGNINWEKHADRAARWSTGSKEKC
jgi:hypothetical protein